MRAAVVGHVEWVDFVRVDCLLGSGEIADALEHWEEAAGGGADAAREFTRLGAETAFLTAFGDDDLGRRANLVLEEQGVNVSAATRDAPQRRALTYVERDGERTITVIGEKLVPHATDPLPWAALAATDAVYFCGGDAEAVRLARRARVLVATARELDTVREAGVELDALVGSGRDPRERYEPGDLDPPPRLVAMTEGAEGGRYTASGEDGRWTAAPLRAPLRDRYGAGDAFAAGLAYALADGRTVADALAFAARSGAHAMTARGGGSPR